MVEAETTFPANSQSYFFNGKKLDDDNQTLEAAGIKDGEMLAMVVNRRNQTPVRPQRSQDDRSPAAIEQIRSDIASNPQQISRLIQQQPDLAAVVNDPVQFRNLWIRMLDERDRMQRQQEEHNKTLNDDPFDPEAQKKIEAMIRMEKIEANLQYAYENNPEVFGRVSMLYVDVLVNNHPVKAFVDSGAQSTIMSPDCAEACGISYLIDDRFGGIARGVGTAKILGRVHQAKIQIGDAELDCSFTVMEGKDVDLLFGLDMLRRHQACIDLLTNELRFPHTSVQFLPESQIPKKFEEAMMDEPTVEGPNGTEVGAKTGAVRPAGTSQEAASHLHGSGKQPVQSGPSTAGPSSATAASAPRRAPAPAPAPAQSKWPEKDINILVEMGMSKVAAAQALDAAGGNVDVAAGMMFD
ncbi:hypothetical protein BLS_005017 [Venturia inaequalis]|uniref:DNA damage-inducible protein 1 n=1 Tax=Venturia inaequalis TaxID=5025 RepID=A0A8H3UJ61_VENIN|nr:hypothetical protein BLS_005017 [Venturia inaequalis]KAE9976379.1 hypothetical protein EG328_002648 [Venturia inaequalis]KAE9985244.1 hypothetical protein EG327_004795 [Venturia inaequalis]RDI86884.1 hypothetical protein Vi05172_g3296 [Venturia inaequalis]